MSFFCGETVIRSTRVWVSSIETQGERKAYISFDISASSAWVTLRLRVTAWFWLSSFVLRVRVWRSRRECAIKHTNESFFSSLSSSSVTCREREKERERERKGEKEREKERERVTTLNKDACARERERQTARVFNVNSSKVWTIPFYLNLIRSRNPSQCSSDSRILFKKAIEIFAWHACIYNNRD